MRRKFWILGLMIYSITSIIAIIIALNITPTHMIDLSVSSWDNTEEVGLGELKVEYHADVHNRVIVANGPQYFIRFIPIRNDFYEKLIKQDSYLGETSIRITTTKIFSGYEFAVDGNILFLYFDTDMRQWVLQNLCYEFLDVKDANDNNLPYSMSFPSPSFRIYNISDYMTDVAYKQVWFFLDANYVKVYFNYILDNFEFDELKDFYSRFSTISSIDDNLETITILPSIVPDNGITPTEGEIIINYDTKTVQISVDGYDDLNYDYSEFFEI